MSLFKKKEKKPEYENVLTEEQKKEIKRQQTLITDVLYPLLVKHSKSVEDAKRIVGSFLVTVRQEYNNKINEYQLNQLMFRERIFKEETGDCFRDLYDALATEKVGTATYLLDGMDKVIDSFVKEKNTKTKFDELIDDPIKIIENPKQCDAKTVEKK